MKEIKADISIIGAGLSGLMAAYTLSRLGLNIILLDRFGFISQKNNKYDLRTTAIAEGSKIFLESIGFWDKIDKYTEQIKYIRVHDRSEKNIIDFKNIKKKNSNLGYIVRNTIIKNLLLKEIKSKKNIQLIDNLTIKDIKKSDNFITLSSNKIKIITNLLIAADGKNSFVRQKLNTKIYKKEYKHKALVVNFNHTKNHNNFAYELFYNTGPLAILPMQSSKKNIFSSSVIWTNKPNHIDSLGSIQESLLASILQEKINTYVGEVCKINDVQTFNLSAHINHKFYDLRAMYVGDAAHSIHPIAGQGWNLGLRDIKNCFAVIEKNLSLGVDIGSSHVCKSYHDKSYYDSFFLFQITDKLNSIFIDENIIIKQIRNKGFKLINKRKKLKNLISNFAMGF